MARSELVMAASPEDVWAVLAEPPHYADWVVGSSEIRRWDPEWPAIGSRFYHRVGIAPFLISDHTEVIAAEPPRQLVLRAKARPLGVARVEVTVARHPAGSLVTMVEDPDLPLASLVVPPPIHALIRVRNGESLRRLRRLAERSAAASPPRRKRAHASGYA